MGSGAENEFNVISWAIYNILTAATQKNIKNIVIPLLWTGIIGDLTSKQSINAIMSGIIAFQKNQWDNKILDKITIAIYGDKVVFQNVGYVLKNKLYQSASPEIGNKVFDFKRRTFEMNKDHMS